MNQPRRSRRRSTPLLAAAAGVAASALIAGCSTAQPGAAAVVGGVTIPESQIAEQVREINIAAGQPATAPAAAAAVSLVNYAIAYELVDQAAAQAGIDVAPGAVDRAYKDLVLQSGGAEQLAQLAASQGVPASTLRRDVETQLKVGALANTFAANAPEAEQRAALLSELGRISDEIGVSVAPKYGAWDSQSLQLAPLPDPVSVPAGRQPAEDPAAPAPQ